MTIILLDPMLELELRLDTVFLTNLCQGCCPLQIFQDSLELQSGRIDALMLLRYKAVSALCFIPAYPSPDSRPVYSEIFRNLFEGALPLQISLTSFYHCLYCYLGFMWHKKDAPLSRTLIFSLSYLRGAYHEPGAFLCVCDKRKRHRFLGDDGGTPASRGTPVSGGAFLTSRRYAAGSI